MMNYVRADVRRIVMRIPRIVILAVCYAVSVFIYFNSARQDGWNSVEFLSFVQGLCMFIPLVFGVIELISVYSDDFRAKTMQVAIGIGIPRRKVVLAKGIETALLVGADMLLYIVLFCLCNLITGTSLIAEQIGELLWQFLCCWFTVVAYTAPTMILLFFMQNTGISTLLYILFSTSLVNTAAKKLTELKALRPLHLTNLLLTTAVENFRTRMILGVFDLKNFIIVLIYIVGCYLITAKLFKSRELEF